MHNGKTKEIILKKFIKEKSLYDTKEVDTKEVDTKEVDTKEVDTKHVHDFTKDTIDSNITISKKKTYTYYADELMNSTNKQCMTNKTIHICLYHIVTEYYKPFVVFLLCKDDNNRLNFLNEKSVETAIKKATTFKGFIEDGDDVYFIMETKTKTKTNTLQSEVYQWALSTELVNNKKVLNVDIDPLVTHFFLENNKLLFVYDKEGHQYECPSVAYCYKNVAKIGGLCREGPTAPFGPFYYFDLEYKEKEKCGVRFAIFTGKQLVKAKPFTIATIREDFINEHYDSLLFNSTLVVKTFEQQVLL